MTVVSVKYCGTTTGYARGCRCDRCRHALNEYSRMFRAGIRKGKGRPDLGLRHGTITAYTNKGCRCEKCRLSWREYQRLAKRAYRAGKKPPRPSTCEVCGRSFMPKRSAACCSTRCYSKRARDPRYKPQRAYKRRCLVTGNGSEGRRAPPRMVSLSARKRGSYEREQQAEIAAARANPELADLIAAQERDDNQYLWAGKKWETSLDAEMRLVNPNNDGETVTAYWFIADAQVDMERQLDEEQLLSIVGDMRPEDVARLDEYSLSRLQDRLRAEGLSTIRVTQGERERLRSPQPHSGAAVKKSKSRGAKKKRREKLGRSGRPEQKPRKRWTRDEWEYEDVAA